MSKERGIEKIMKMMGDPQKVARELESFKQEAKSYDPSPDRVLILQKAA